MTLCTGLDAIGHFNEPFRQQIVRELAENPQIRTKAFNDYSTAKDEDKLEILDSNFNVQGNLTDIQYEDLKDRLC